MAYSAHAGMLFSIASDGTELPAVTYYTTYDKLYDKLKQDFTIDPAGTTAKTDWVTDAYSGWTPKMQSVHMAEGKYSNGTWHEAWYWGDIKGLVGTGDGYDNTDPADTLESWTIGNVTGEATAGIGDSDFPGGFAGKCDTAQNWVYEDDNDPTTNDWTCSGEVPWSQGVLLPSVKDTSNHIGMVIMPFNWKGVLPSSDSETDVLDLGMNSWRAAYGQFNSKPVSDVSDSWNISKVVTTCYPGGLDLNLDDNKVPQNPNAVSGTDYFRKEVSIDSDTRDVPLEVSGQVAMADNDSYRCNWKYVPRDDTKDHLNSTGSPKLIQNDDAASSYFADKYSEWFSSSNWDALGIWAGNN